MLALQVPGPATHTVVPMLPAGQLVATADHLAAELEVVARSDVRLRARGYSADALADYAAQVLDPRTGLQGWATTFRPAVQLFRDEAVALMVAAATETAAAAADVSTYRMPWPAPRAARSSRPSLTAASDLVATLRAAMADTTLAPINTVVDAMSALPTVLGQLAAALTPAASATASPGLRMHPRGCGLGMAGHTNTRPTQGGRPRFPRRWRLHGRCRCPSWARVCAVILPRVQARAGARLTHADGPGWAWASIDATAAAVAAVRRSGPADDTWASVQLARLTTLAHSLADSPNATVHAYGHTHAYIHVHAAVRQF
jgi:hypothetical protein